MKYEQNAAQPILSQGEINSKPRPAPWCLGSIWIEPLQFGPRKGDTCTAEGGSERSSEKPEEGPPKEPRAICTYSWFQTLWRGQVFTRFAPTAAQSKDSNGRVLEELCIEYKGPATVMCFDEFGMLQSVDFVGVCDEFGRNCQSMDAEWVGEQWRWDVQKKVFLYRNVSGQTLCLQRWTQTQVSLEF